MKEKKLVHIVKSVGHVLIRTIFYYGLILAICLVNPVSSIRHFGTIIWDPTSIPMSVEGFRFSLGFATNLEYDGSSPFYRQPLLFQIAIFSGLLSSVLFGFTVARRMNTRVHSAISSTIIVIWMLFVRGEIVAPFGLWSNIFSTWCAFVPTFFVVSGWSAPGVPQKLKTL